MSERRIELQSLLEEILGSRNVYFQPPSSIALKYPCIVYEREDENVKHADDSTYSRIKLYTVTVIDKDPDSEIPDKISDLPLCTFQRHFTSENLNHDVYRLYF